MEEILIVRNIQGGAEWIWVMGPKINLNYSISSHHILRKNLTVKQSWNLAIICFYLKCWRQERNINLIGFAYCSSLCEWVVVRFLEFHAVFMSLVPQHFEDYCDRCYFWGIPKKKVQGSKIWISDWPSNISESGYQSTRKSVSQDVDVDSRCAVLFEVQLPEAGKKNYRTDSQYVEQLNTEVEREV